MLINPINWCTQMALFSSWDRVGLRRRNVFAGIAPQADRFGSCFSSDEPLCIQSTKQIVYYPAPKVRRQTFPAQVVEFDIIAPLS
jgi:hypothetical protein